MAKKEGRKKITKPLPLPMKNADVKTELLLPLGEKKEHKNLAITQSSQQGWMVRCSQRTEREHGGFGIQEIRENHMD